MQKKRWCVLGIILIALLVLPACAQQKPAAQTTETVKLYYGDAQNEKMVTEEREISYRDQAAKYQTVLEELINGPQNESYRSNISTNTTVYGTIRQNDKLIVDLSEEFTQFGGSVAEIIGIGSVVNTLTQFEDIDQVKILVEGEELIGPSGAPRGFMQPFSDDPRADLNQKLDVTLYFGTPNADAVRGETRTVTVPADSSQEDFLTIVLNELIRGPQDQELSRTIPAEVRVKSVVITDQTAIVDFSEEMHSKHWGGAAGESLTIASIVNTLTEFDYVRLVKMTVEGQPMAIEHAVLHDPLPRNEKMIAR